MPPDLKAHFCEVVGLMRELAVAPLPLPEDKLSRLTEVLRSVDASPAYRERFNRVQQKMSEYLSRALDLGSIISDYPRFSNAEKISWLQKHVNELARIQSCKDIEVTPALIEECHWGSDGDRAHTGFDPNYNGPDSQNIFLNFDVKEIAECPIEALHSVLHEQWHHFNNMLARSAKFQTLPPDHPLASDARYFAAQWEHKAFITISPPYGAQLDERFATAFGRAVQGVLKAASVQDRPRSGSMTDYIFATPKPSDPAFA